MRGETKNSKLKIFFLIIILLLIGIAVLDTLHNRFTKVKGIQFNSITLNSSQLPQAMLEIDKHKVNCVVNGYHWSNKTNNFVIADPASVPAQNLKIHSATIGSNVKIFFDLSPQRIQITRWLKGSKPIKHDLNTPTVSLPAKPGVYTYEITAAWGKKYINYDFKVQVH